MTKRISLAARHTPPGAALAGLAMNNGPIGSVHGLAGKLPVRGRPLADLFESIAVERAEQTAYDDGMRQWTFGELCAAARNISGNLYALGVGKSKRVALVTAHSLETVAAFYATLLLGATLVPVDSRLPKRLIRARIRRVRASLVVHDKEGAKFGSCRTVPLEALLATSALFPKPSARGARDDLLIVFTSASTGAAKPVRITEASVSNRLEWMWREFPFAGRECLACIKHPSLVGSIWELLGATLQGVKVALIKREELLDPVLLFRRLQKSRVTRLHAAPPVLANLARLERRRFRGWQPSLVTSSAEPLPQALATRWYHRFPTSRLYNLFGATECSSNASSYLAKPMGPSNIVPIGQPIDNVSLSIVDSVGRSLPPGAIGELKITGACVSPGYVGASAHPAFTITGSRRSFQTGDFGFVNASGDVELVGRRDSAIKARGHKVHLEEIESIYSGFPGVHRCAAIPVGPTAAANRIHLVYVADGQLPARDLRSFGRDRLPEAAIPVGYKKIKAIPTLPSGKIDRLGARRLLSTSNGMGQRRQYRLDLKSEIGALVRRAVGMPISDNSNIVELGVDSMAMVDIQLGLSAITGSQVLLSDLTTHPSIATLVVYVENIAQSKVSLARKPMITLSDTGHGYRSS